MEMGLQAFITIDAVGDFERCADEWHLLCVEAVERLISDLGREVDVGSSGSASLPDSPSMPVAWRNERRMPSEVGVPFGARFMFADATYVRDPQAGDRDEDIFSTKLLVVVPREGPSSLDLSFEMDGIDVFGAQRVSSLLRDLVAAYGHKVDLAFANVAPDNLVGRTALEAALERVSPVARAEARRVLRGYSWVTLVPRELVPAIRPRLVQFPQITWRELGSGAALVQAGDDIGAYEECYMEMVFELLAPVLPGGMPSILPAYTGLPPEWLVARDAREVSAYHWDG